jgi:hypothetical protein
MPTTSNTEPLAKLREPFPAHQISKLPKPYKKDSPKGKCAECGGYHGLPAVHLDYVGHAALTDRLLDVDPHWTWEPVADPVGNGLPVAPGGMWIKLTVCGVSRYGFGHPDGKQGGDAVKETIGDALRNAAMRFGAALDLWHKGDLHADSDEPKADSGDDNYDPEPPLGSNRLSSFEAKRQGLGESIKNFIDRATANELDHWEKNFDRNTGHLPAAWLPDIRQRIEQRREELNGEANVAEQEAELDAGFRGAVGVIRASELPRRGSDVAA